MNKNSNSTVPRSKKKADKYSEKVVIHATYDELLKVAINQPPKNKIKKAA